MGLVRKLNAAVIPVTHTAAEQKYIKDNNLNLNMSHPLPPPTVTMSVTEAIPPKPGDLSTPRNAEGKEYIMMEVKGSNNKVYKVCIPQSYAKLIPKVWSWNDTRFKVAELISAGIPMTEISKICDVSRHAIYGWLQHPEFKEHVDGITMETGWANKRERIAGLNKLTRLLFDKVINEIDGVKLTDKSIGAVLTSIQTIAKQLGIEKDEFVEQTKVEQNTTVSGVIGIAAIPVETLLNSKSTEDRAALEAEFDSVGDNLIRSITGERD
jgi:hypothetical protein